MMKKSLLLVALALLPLFALAQWQPVRGQTTSSASTNQSYDNWWSRRFTVGLTFTGDFYKYAGGVGAGLLFNFGRDTDLLNVSFGAEYIEYLASDPRPEELKSKLNIIDAGGQLVVPVMAKLLFLRTSEWSKVYIGCGAEWGFRMRDGSSLADYYPEGHVLRKTSMAVVPMLGSRSYNLDFGIYYKHYFDKPFNNSLDGKKNLGETDKRIGCYLTWFF
ncbi:MAG: hypothetical protein IJK08_05535 [Prevotella sp.]|nr:hypothetical protein [Prevotella sp.]